MTLVIYLILYKIKYKFLSLSYKPKSLYPQTDCVPAPPDLPFYEYIIHDSIHSLTRTHIYSRNIASDLQRIATQYDIILEYQGSRHRGGNI